MKSQLMTIQEVADIFRVCPETIRRWDNQGKLKAVRIGGRKGVGDRRYRESDVKQYLKKL